MNDVLVHFAKTYPCEMLLVNKELTQVASQELTCQRIEFLKKLAQDLINQNINPSLSETLMAKVLAPEPPNTPLSCLRESIASLYKSSYPRLHYKTTFHPFKNYNFPIHIDIPLFLNIISDTSETVTWYNDSYEGFSKEYILCYLALMEKNLIAPKGLYIQAECIPYNGLFKSIAQAVSKCSSLQQIDLFFRGWDHKELEQVLSALKENQKIHTAIFCELTSINPAEFTSLGGWKQYVPFLPRDHKLELSELHQKSFPPECSKLISNMLGEHFQIQYGSHTTLQPSISLKRIVKQDPQEL